MNRKGIRFCCEVCKGLCKMQCDGCKQAYYCSIEHQKAHWNDHKGYCKSMAAIKVERYPNSDGINRRVLLACDNFKKGDIIFTEAALLRGPDENLKTPAEILKSIQIISTSCIVCHRNLEPNSDRSHYLRHLCAKCFWPVCCKNCQTYHSQLECKTLQGITPKGFTTQIPPWKFIMILRALLYRTKHPKGYKALMKLDIHPKMDDYEKLLPSNQLDPKHLETPKLIDSRRSLLRDTLKLLRHYKLNKFVKEERLVDHIIQVLEWNSRVITVHKDQDKCIARNGIYTLISAASQSCSPNVLTYLLVDHKLVCIAAQDIKTGESIRVSKSPSSIMCDNYYRGLWLSSRFIVCGCKRCEDPTELKTYHGSLKCCNFEGVERSGCGTGNLLLFKDSDNRQSLYLWKCESCNVEREDPIVKKLLGRIQNEKYDALDTAFASFTTKSLGRFRKSKNSLSISYMRGGDLIQKFIHKYANEFLHPNHYIIFEAKLKLCRVLSEGIREIFGLDSQNDFREQITEAAQLIWDITKELLVIVGVLQPGLSCIRAKVIFYRQQAFGYLAPHLLKTEFRTAAKKAEFKRILAEMTSAREEARILFTHFLVTQPKIAEKLNKMKLDDTLYRTLQQYSYIYGDVKTELYNPLEPRFEEQWALTDL